MSDLKSSEAIKQTPSVDLIEAPEHRGVLGREKEVERLHDQIISNDCRFIGIFGPGGIGKSAFVAKLVAEVKEDQRHSFQYVIWRTLRYGPKPHEIFDDILSQVPRPSKLEGEGILEKLLTHITHNNCLIILDNLESVLCLSGRFKEDYELYGKFLTFVARKQHRSCLIITSREKPRLLLLSREELQNQGIILRELKGLPSEYVEEILRDYDLKGRHHTKDEEEIDDWQRLTYTHSGNPLALKIAGYHIEQNFGGSIDLYLKKFLQRGETSYQINELLNSQFERLPDIERSVMYWLAVLKDMRSLPKISLFVPDKPKENGPALKDVLESLCRRSLCHQLSESDYDLLPDIDHYATQQFVVEIAQEISKCTNEKSKNGKCKLSELQLFRTHALLLGKAPWKTRDLQRKFVIAPILKLLRENEDGDREKVSERLEIILKNVQERDDSYAAGNIANLLSTLWDGSLSDLVKKKQIRFSKRTVRHADFREVELQDVDFSGADLRESVFSDEFGGILSLACHPKREVLAAGTTRNKVHAWSIETMEKEWEPLAGHTDWVRSVAFSGDGLFASAGEDGSICLFDNGNKRPTTIHKAHDGRRIWCIRFDPRAGNALLASAGEDGTIKLWDAETGILRQILQGHNGAVRALCFSSNGCEHLLASGGDDSKIRLWKIIPEANWRADFDGELSAEGRIMALAFAKPKEFPKTKLISCSDVSPPTLWDVSTRLRDDKQFYNADQASGIMTAIAVNADQTLFAAASETQLIWVWNIITSKCKKCDGHESQVMAVVFDVKDSNILYSGGEDCTLRKWDVGTPDKWDIGTSKAQCLDVLQGFTNPVWSAAFHPAKERQLIASGSEDRFVRLWSLGEDGPKGRRLKSPHKGRIRSVAFSPSGNKLACGSEDGTISLWDTASEKLLDTLVGHQGRVRCIAFNPRIPDMLATAGEDKRVRIWKVSTGVCVYKNLKQESPIYSVAFSRNGHLIAAGDNRKVTIWEIEDESLWETAEWKEDPCLVGHEGRIWSITCHPQDDDLIISGSDDESVRVWSRHSQSSIVISKDSPLHPVPVGKVLSMAFSPSGRFIAFGNRSGEVQLWEIKKLDRNAPELKRRRTFREARGQEARPYWTVTVAFSPDDKWILSNREDGGLDIWRTESDSDERKYDIQPQVPYLHMDITNSLLSSDAVGNTLKQLGAIR